MKFLTAGAALSILAILVSGPAQARWNGSPDPNFGVGGLVQVDIGQGGLGWVDMAIDAEGRLVLAGSSDRGPATGLDFVVARLLPDGSLDSSFSFDGKVELAVGPDDSLDQAFSVLVQHDGRIVVAGTARSPIPGFGQDMALVRLMANGELDPGFGSGGKVFVHFGLADGPDGSDELRKVLQLPDGRLLGVGSTTVADQGWDMAVVKLNSDGTRDTGFGSNGRATVRFALNPDQLDDQAMSAAIDSAGRIILAGYTYKSGFADTDMAVARLLPNGQLDANFGGDGRTTVAFDFGGNLQDMALGVMVDDDDHITLIGSAQDTGLDVALARLHPDGSLDPAFGNQGRATVAFDLGGLSQDQGISVIRLDDGGLVLAGLGATAEGEASCIVARLLADGSPDPDFGVVGKMVIDNPFGGSVIGCTRMLEHDGRLMIAGIATTGPDNQVGSLFVGALLNDVLFADGFQED